MNGTDVSGDVAVFVLNRINFYFVFTISVLLVQWFVYERHKFDKIFNQDLLTLCERNCGSSVTTRKQNEMIK